MKAGRALARSLVLASALFTLFSWEASAQESESKSSFLSNISPNTVSFDVSQGQTLINLDQRPQLIGIDRTASSDQLGEASQLAGRLSLTSTLPAEGGGVHLALHWVPMLTFAFQDVTFQSQSVFLADTDFQMFRTSLGFGPEVALSSKIGTFYIEVAPGVAYSWVSWSSPVSGGSIGQANFNLAGTAGYQRFFADHWAVRLFTQYIIEDTDVWKDALSSSQGFEVPVESVSNLVFGISLCWAFGAQPAGLSKVAAN